MSLGNCPRCPWGPCQQICHLRFGEGLAFMCPHCLQHCCGTPNCLLLMGGVMKNQIKFFCPHSLYFSELLEDSWVSHMEYQSLSDNWKLISCSYFNLMYNELFPFQLSKLSYNSEMILTGVVCMQLWIHLSILYLLLGFLFYFLDHKNVSAVDTWTRNVLETEFFNLYLFSKFICIAHFVHNTIQGALHKTLEALKEPLEYFKNTKE